MDLLLYFEKSALTVGENMLFYYHASELSRLHRQSPNLKQKADHPDIQQRKSY